ncbi:MAG: PilZ domain-containing protein [Calditrichaceae bacterium]|nr:PilZ domain-containing protein [Calditrichaceae bacterium]MBN2709690.1 PilZ domain-containing protein [Calditrichaceae bacterium]RQV94473.1 MAG: hypothetical protein EH224_10295 [Calditrichota bacterium]
MTNDKRKFDRINIPNAFVSICNNMNSFIFFSKNSEKYPLIDLTKSGLCFKSTRNFKIGESITVEIKVDHHRGFKLKVHVLWTKLDKKDHSYFIGARIHAFGNFGDLNSLKCLEKLKQLELSYSNHDV